MSRSTARQQQTSGAKVSVSMPSPTPSSASPDWLRKALPTILAAMLGGGVGVTAHTIAAAPPPVVLRVEFDSLQKLVESSEHRIKQLEDLRSSDAIDAAGWRQEVRGDIRQMTVQIADMKAILQRLGR